MNHQLPLLNTMFDLGCGQSASPFSSGYCNEAPYQTAPPTNIAPGYGGRYSAPLPAHQSPFTCNTHEAGTFVGKQMSPSAYPSVSSQQGSGPYYPSSGRSGQPLIYPNVHAHPDTLESSVHQTPFQFLPSRYDSQGIASPAQSPMSSSSFSEQSSFPQLPLSMNTMDFLAKDTSGIDWAQTEFMHQMCDGTDHHGIFTNSPQFSNFSDIQGLPFDSQSWSDMISLGVNPSDSGTSSSHRPVPLNQYPLFPHFEASPFSSPSPSPSPSREFLRRVSPLSSAASTPPSSRRSSVDLSPGVKRCSHCRATSTPLWRREPTTLKPLCNACGLYLQQRNKLRPQELIDADADDDESGDLSSENQTGPECSHCHTRQTSVWRRSKAGAQLCNACGVYSRLRGKDRPLSLKRNRIKPRSKHTSK